jgi:hypothetical protein
LGESERLRADHACRDAELPPGRYSPAYPTHLFIRHTVERALVRIFPPLAVHRVLEVAFGAPRDRLAGLDLVPGTDCRRAGALAGADILDVVVQSMMLSSVLDASVSGGRRGRWLGCWLRAA